jgi:hypothetical protein
MEKAVKEIERMGVEFERDSRRDFQQQQRVAKPTKQQQESSEESLLGNMSLEDMMA